MAWAAVFRLIGSAVSSAGGGAAATGGGAAASGAGVSSVLGKATSAMKSFGSAVQGETFKALSVFEVMKGSLNGIVQGFANATAMGKQFTNLGMRFNMSASAVGSLSVFANDAGISLGVLAKGMQQVQTFANKMDATKKFKDVAKMLGISEEEQKVMQKDKVEALAIMSVKLKDIADEGQKMQALQSVFGRGAMQMRQLMEMNPEEMRRAMKNSYAADDSALASANRIEKMQSDLGNYAKATGVQFLQSLEPVIGIVTKIGVVLVWGISKAVELARRMSLQIQIIGLSIKKWFQFGKEEIETDREIQRLKKEQEAARLAGEKSTQQAAKLLGLAEDTTKEAEKVAGYYKQAAMDAEDIAKAAEDAADFAARESKWRMYSAEQLEAANKRVEARARRELEEKMKAVQDRELESAQKELGTPDTLTTEDLKYNAENYTQILLGKVEPRITKGVKGALMEKEEEKLSDNKKLLEQYEKEAADAESLAKQMAIAAAQQVRMGAVGTGAGGLTQIAPGGNPETARLQAERAAELKSKAQQMREEIARNEQNIEGIKKRRDEMMNLLAPQTVLTSDGGSRFETRLETLQRVAKSMKRLGGEVTGEGGFVEQDIKLREQERQNRLAEAKRRMQESDTDAKTKKAGKEYLRMFQTFMNEKTNPLGNLKIQEQRAMDEAADAIRKLNELKAAGTTDEEIVRGEKAVELAKVGVFSAQQELEALQKDAEGKYDDKDPEKKKEKQAQKAIDEKAANEKIAAAVKDQQLAELKLQELKDAQVLDQREIKDAEAAVTNASANVAKVMLENKKKADSFFTTTGDSLQAVGGGGATALSASAIFKRQADNVEAIRGMMHDALVKSGTAGTWNERLGRYEYDPAKFGGTDTMIDETMGPLVNSPR